MVNFIVSLSLSLIFQIYFGVTNKLTVISERPGKFVVADLKLLILNKYFMIANTKQSSFTAFTVFF